MSTTPNPTKKIPALIERSTLLWISAAAAVGGALIGYGAKAYVDKRSEEKANSHANNGGGQLNFDGAQYQQGVPANGSVTIPVRM